MGLVEYKGLLMEEEVVEQLRIRDGQDFTGRRDEETVRRKQAAIITQDSAGMQNAISKENGINGVGSNSDKAANDEEKNFISKHNKETVCDRDKEDDCMR